MYLLIVFFLKTLSPLVLLVPTFHQNPSPQTGLQDLLVTQYDCEENEQKTLNKYAINQVTQCESELRVIESTNIIATLYSKARATTLAVYEFIAKFSEKKYLAHKFEMETKMDSTTNLFFEGTSKDSEDCKNEQKRLKLTTNKGTNHKLVNFQVFPDSAHQAKRVLLDVQILGRLENLLICD